MAVQIDHVVVTVQELLPGAKIDQLDQVGLEQALELNRLQTGRLADRPDIAQVGLYLTEDGSGYCLHEPLRRHNRRTAALEGWITAVGEDNPDQLVGYDAVHYDFHPGNMLAVGDAITGIVDWDGAGRGDRRFDLVTLRFGIHAKTCEPGVAKRLDDVLDALPGDLLRLTWAHMSLRMVDWAIRHFAPADVEHWLDLAEQRAYQ